MWKKLGEFAVDSGTFMITDPCYCAIVDPTGEKGTINRPCTGNNDSSFPIAFVDHTGGGDGTYHVEGRHTDDGALIEIRVQFLSE